LGDGQRSLQERLDFPDMVEDSFTLITGHGRPAHWGSIYTYQ
jgi:hypothetical protein